MSRQPVDLSVHINHTVERGHPAVDEWLDDCIDALVTAIWSAHAVVDVPVLVIDADIDGGLIDKLIARLKPTLAANAPEARRAPDVVRGTFGQDAGAIGAASLPMFFNFSPRASILTGEDTLQGRGAPMPGGPMPPVAAMRR